MTVKEQLLLDYIKLSRKLGKLASKREVNKFLCSDDKVKNHFGSLNALKDAAIVKDEVLAESLVPAELTIEDIEAYRMGLEKNKRKTGNKLVVKSVSGLEYLARFADSIFSGRVKAYMPARPRTNLKRAFNLTLSDLHFGADVHSAETGYLDYGTVEEARRFATIIKQTIDYKPQYRAETVLHVNLLGDIIQNKLHDPQDAAPQAEQVCRAIHLLIQGFALLAQSFPKLVIHCAVGNHGRDTARHPKRATSGKWDSIETVIYYAIKTALKDFKNVEVEIPKTPFVIYEVFGHKVFATHGDTVLNPGNPGNSLNIKSLENQVNRINASLNDNDEVRVAIVGHTHNASVSSLGSGCYLITNGALTPVDQFATSIGILENRSSQTIFEMTEGYPLGDVRFIKVGPDEDKDKRLDKLILPWTSF